MRTDLSGNPTFQEVLRQVRGVALEAYAHQDLPFDLLVQSLPQERDLSRSALFQVMFILQNLPSYTLELAGLRFSPIELETNTAKFDLTLEVREDETGLYFHFEYNTDLFADNTITRMVRHFETLLISIINNPEQKISGLNILEDTEKHNLLVAWNETEQPFDDICIHEVFEAQVVRTPETAAAVFEGQSLTYRELNERANQLAHHLQTLGVRPDTRVGIYMERSLDMITGLLGILKAGGAYIPLIRPCPPTGWNLCCVTLRLTFC